MLYTGMKMLDDCNVHRREQHGGSTQYFRKPDAGDPKAFHCDTCGPGACEYLDEFRRIFAQAPDEAVTRVVDRFFVACGAQYAKEVLPFLVSFTKMLLPTVTYQ
ncbi:hypothetical protein M413DRAFT_24953 [Hebeloma cylindrosporum]|uniref:Uncharacterized protein n=1 Tax=Hebeloma cylindrosporum TaxID=76867 RepID=A0A0C2Y3N0_HEBCY|nr:hypothetical protein M413DRAFT_24953 [Hebeloma cylindrosporum h7]